MDAYKPTAQLRYMERTFAQTDECGTVCFAGSEIVLQQLWVYEDAGGPSEWRDVPHGASESVHVGRHKWA